jgi:thymidylate synthase
MDVCGDLWVGVCKDAGVKTEETQYLDLIRKILKEGHWEDTRNGRTLSIFGNSMRFSLKDGTIPFITTKKLAWKTCFHELTWFIRGMTNNKILQDKGVHIWDANTSREFLNSKGLSHYQEGDLGPGYGFQWRHWNAMYVDCNTDYSGEGIDQLQCLINNLKNPETRISRKHVITAWNPEQLNMMALEPCHILMQFNVYENKYLSCSLYQRSGDVGLGVPFNIASYCFLTHILAKHCDLIADEFVYFLGNAHIYENHMEVLKQQLNNKIFEFPKINIKNKHEHIEDYSIEDIEFIQPYVFNKKMAMDMVA